jgi:hypothetical protein
VNEGVNIPPRGQISPLGARGEIKNDPLSVGFAPRWKVSYRARILKPVVTYDICSKLLQKSSVAIHICLQH